MENIDPFRIFFSCKQRTVENTLFTTGTLENWTKNAENMVLTMFLSMWRNNDNDSELSMNAEKENTQKKFEKNERRLSKKIPRKR